MKLHQGHFLITVDTFTKTVSLIDAKVKCCVCVLGEGVRGRGESSG